MLFTVFCRFLLEFKCCGQKWNIYLARMILLLTKMTLLLSVCICQKVIHRESLIKRSVGFLLWKTHRQAEHFSKVLPHHQSQRYGIKIFKQFCNAVNPNYHYYDYYHYDCYHYDYYHYDYYHYYHYHAVNLDYPSPPNVRQTYLLRRNYSAKLFIFFSSFPEEKLGRLLPRGSL